ncbi:hypothetical protein PT277_05330 [Acetobacteraceae bacterium ESL0709]|nr:hypothetical protein [Acetobacteraceae bacterium ESL0697]MDF7678118.1 hypothetical protein [Acetobacteraceae bacterium ESL0709]
MGVSPSNPQGMLNRLRGSVIVTSNSALNVTSDYLTPDGIVIEHTSDITDMMETMTGFVGAPHSKQDVIVTINLCRSQSLANEWFRQLGKNTYIGKVRIVSDSSVQDDRTIENCYITKQPKQTLNGGQIKWDIQLKGYEVVNSDIWSLS